MLEGFLEQYRVIVLRKVTGFDDDLARRELVASHTTVAGVLRHLTWVEHAWFVEVLDGEPRPGWRDSNPEWQFRAGTEPVAELIMAYREACDRSRRIAESRSLDDTGVHPRMGTVSLRWIYLHMIEEIARHAGHLDILIEQLDGSSGFD